MHTVADPSAPNAGRPVYLGAVHHICGEWNAIETLPEMQNENTLRYSRTLGLERFSRLQGGSLRVPCKTAVLHTLEAAQLKPSELDALIFFSTTFDPYVEGDEVAWLCHEVGLTEVLPLGVFHNQCTNHSQALQVAQQLCQLGSARNVLLLGYDALDDRRASRVMDNNITVYSDAVVSAVVSALPRPQWQYRVDGIAHRFLPDIVSIKTPDTRLQFLQRYSAGFGRVCQELMRSLELTPGHFDRLITANYNRSVVKNLAELAGMPQKSVFLDHIPRYGHCFSADHLIALQVLAETDAPGRRMLLAAAGGHWLFSAVAVTRENGSA